MGNERLGGQFRDQGGVVFCDAEGPISLPSSRTILSDGRNEYRILLPHDPENKGLLHVLRDDVLCKRIPAHDVDSVDLLRSRLNGEEAGIDLVAIVAGNRLSDQFNRVAKGGCLAELYTHPHTNEAHAHLTYLTTLDGYEGEGIGKFLILSRIALLEEKARIKGVPLRTIFIEVCNDNQTNKNKFLKLGAQPGPEGYCRPDVEDSKNIVRDYADMYYPVGGIYPSKNAIAEARACYWRAQGIGTPSAHPDFQAMMDEMKGWTGFSRATNPEFESRLAGFRQKYDFAPPDRETEARSVRAASQSGWAACCL
ncbi:MAG: hypothetical protein H6862_02075 [Rhodospirillales bacterium]|nr:hypothetical protein [Rhodospirillales bacterium]